MTTFLLDANVLIALTIAEHEHHERASHWASVTDRFAVCPIVEGALVRFLLRIGERAESARAVLTSIRGLPRCEFWPDSLSFAEVDVDLSRVRGHRQVTDAYLVALASAHDARLATLDRALAADAPATASLIPER